MARAAQGFAARTVHDYLGLWNWDGTWIASIQVPRESRARSQPHGLHHRQSECEKRCIDSHGFDAGKLIKGKKRHVLVDTQGLLLSPPPTFRIATAVSR